MLFESIVNNPADSIGRRTVKKLSSRHGESMESSQASNDTSQTVSLRNTLTTVITWKLKLTITASKNDDSVTMKSDTLSSDYNKYTHKQ